MKPLAYRMRPEKLDEIIGQKHLIGEGQVIRKCIENQRLFSMIFLPKNIISSKIS